MGIDDIEEKMYKRLVKCLNKCDKYIKKKKLTKEQEEELNYRFYKIFKECVEDYETF